jgi:hypothetical protein
LHGLASGFDASIEPIGNVVAAASAEADRRNPQIPIIQHFPQLSHRRAGQFGRANRTPGVDFDGASSQPGSRKQGLWKGEPQARQLNPDFERGHVSFSAWVARANRAPMGSPA